MIILFWVSLAIAFYTYLGYGILLYVMVLTRRLLKGRRMSPEENIKSLPGCTLVIAAYNEEDFITEKIENTLALEYPDGLLKLLFITDGSDDKTPGIISKYPQILLLHEKERKGKVAALHRAMDQVNTEIVIFTDANTLLNRDALIKIARHYSDKMVGAVAGEKRIQGEERADAGTAGEGFYWMYESTLKKWDSELYSVTGAAGELFSVRKHLYEPVPNDTILDDFMISMLIAAKGYRIIYVPAAYAVETASENIHEELKRKIRIAAGGIQSILRLKALLNIFRHGLFSFQYISHRVLRWTITPFVLIICFLLNIAIVYDTTDQFYILLLASQVLLYGMAFGGYLFEKKKIRFKAFFIPYYFCVMNYAVIAGIKRYITSSQSSAWEKAKRRK